MLRARIGNVNRDLTEVGGEVGEGGKNGNVERRKVEKRSRAWTKKLPWWIMLTGVVDHVEYCRPRSVSSRFDLSVFSALSAFP